MVVERLASYREPVRKSITVACGSAHAFSVFTSGIARWWPLATHSISGDRVRDCVIEPRVGGGVYEVRDDGERFPWGRVLAWDPPTRLVLSWHPGMPAEAAQEVEVRFTAVEKGTRVDLEHRGWEALGPGADDAHKGYNEGWESVFVQRFAAGCAQPEEIS